MRHCSIQSVITRHLYVTQIHIWYSYYNYNYYTLVNGGYGRMDIVLLLCGYIPTNANQKNGHEARLSDEVDKTTDK